LCAVDQGLDPAAKRAALKKRCAPRSRSKYAGNVACPFCHPNGVAGCGCVPTHPFTVRGHAANNRLTPVHADDLLTHKSRRGERRQRIEAVGLAVDHPARAVTESGPLRVGSGLCRIAGCEQESGSGGDKPTDSRRNKRRARSSFHGKQPLVANCDDRCQTITENDPMVHLVPPGRQSSRMPCNCAWTI